MDTQFLLNTLRQSDLNKRIGLNSDRCDGYYRGRVIAQHASRHGIVPNLRGSSELFGFIEYVLEHMEADNGKDQSVS